LWLLTLTTFTGFSVGQSAPISSTNSKSSDGNKKQAEFISVEGEFTIALPEQTIGSRSVPPIEGKTKGGKQFFWETPQGYFTAGFVELYSAENGKSVIQSTSADLIEQVLSDGGKLISKKEILFKGNSGLELIMRLKNAVIVIGRHYVVSKRIYTITSGWREGEDGAQQIKVLDSFKLIDGKNALYKKIDENTPQALPQSPVSNKLKSDAQDNNLKGKVKKVIEEREELAEDGSVKIKRVSLIEDYDEKGNWLRRVYFDSQGNPYSIAVYGYIEGMRVSNSKYIEYDYDPPAPRAPPKPAGEAPKPSDPRYQGGYEYKYVGGKLAEMQMFGSNGKKGMRYVYNRSGNQLEESVYTSDGKLNQKFLSILDNDGNVIEKTYFDLLEPKIYGDKKYSVKYDSFDKNGNWTKKTTLLVTIENGKEVLKPSFVNYRTITYYQ
jgi:hypothetical protein